MGKLRTETAGFRRGPAVQGQARHRLDARAYAQRRAGRQQMFIDRAWRQAEMHGGVLKIRSDEGQGTIVSVRIPVSQLKAAA